MSAAQVLFELLRGSSPIQIPSSDLWQQVLEFADRTQLTLYLRGCPRLPLAIERGIEARFARNEIRRRRLEEAYLEIQETLAACDVPFIVLKGFTHEAGFGIPKDCRVQYDLDFLTRPPNLRGAQRALENLGYRPHGQASLSEEHGRPWVRPFTWRWRGDYFDPDMPIPVELHDTIWSQARDHIEGPDAAMFWERAGVTEVSGVPVPALCEVDRLAFAALHALRHLLRNDARLSHVWELARLLETRAADDEFWAEWQWAHSPRLRLLQVVAFRFAEEWFLCRLPEAVAQECAALPAPVAQWFREFAWSPVHNLTGANKDVVWLHLALVDGWRERLSVLKERLVPLRLPHHEEAGDYRARLQERLRYHAAAFVPALRGGVRWWRRTASSTVSQSSD
jgi:hypothetical protein